MATTKQQMDAFTRALNKAMAKTVDRKSMIEYGKLVVDLVVARTRYKGQGVAENGGRARKLKSVSAKYAKRRQNMERHPDAANGRKSNLTLTGEMLDSLTVIKSRNKSVEVGWNDKDEAAKARGNEDRGRPFLNLTTSEVNIISKQLDKKLSKEAKKI